MAQHLTTEEVKEAIQEAIDSWDFEALQDGTGEKQQQALHDLLFKADRNFPNGLDIPCGFTDIWDWLAEWASSTAADMI